MISLQIKITSYLAFVLLLFGAQCSILNGQFLFTYEINQESDDSRAPKSSLFDPSSFRIVTPSQLQNTYQKLSSQSIDSPPSSTVSSSSPPVLASAADSLPVSPINNDQSEVAAGALEQAQHQHEAPPSSSHHHHHQQQPARHQQAPSLLKQTSAALQSFAELFSLSSPTSSPSPLSAIQGPQQQQSVNNAGVDQQAEARSLHEHWTQQQQSSHQHLAPLNTNHEFNQLQTHPSGPQSIATAALNSFTTSQPAGTNSLQSHQAEQQPSQSNHNHQPQPSQASYWLTANPLNSPDGNYLVQVKQQQQVSSPATLIDNLLTVGSPRSPLMNQPLPNRDSSPKSSPMATTSAANLAQASFLATPTSYYPAPVESSTRVSRPTSTQHHHHQHVPSEPFGSPATASSPHQHFPRAAANFVHTTTPSTSTSLFRSLQDNNSPPQQLQPPANIPENFVQPLQTSHHNQRHHHKSAEESLISFRQQQNQQHDQQSALFSAQHQLVSNQQHNQKPRSGNHFQINQQQQHNSAASFQSTNNNNHHHHHHQQQQQQQQQPRQQLTLSQPVNQPQNSQQNHAHHQLGEIPKVSPQIYESFLLQQRDQHEKHMELLKQQQELNKLLEQKHKQQEAELKRKRKKEELENANSKEVARKKAIREQEIAKKLKFEQEEREREALKKRQRDEEERKQLLRLAAAEEQQRRYREFLETKEREKREREAAVALKRQRLLAEEEEARELKIRLEREREQVAERRRQAELLATEKQRREKEAEDAKYVNYLRQQEELRKLLELKQKEDDAIQNRRKQAIALQQQQRSSASAQQLGRASRLATASSSDNRRDQADQHQSNSPRSSWGAPIRSRQVASMQTNQELSLTTPATTTTTLNTTTTTQQVPSVKPASEIRNRQKSEAEAIVNNVQQKRPRGYLVKKQRTLDEKLIRQKIPLYSGPGQYGLYRGGNESLANDVAALLDSVILPSSATSTTTTTTSTSTSTTTTPAPAPDASRQDDSSSAAVTPSLSDSLASSSLSPLLNRADLSTERFSTMQPADQGTSPSGEPFFDDDVPRRPARGVTVPVASTNTQNSNSNGQKTFGAPSSSSSNQKLSTSRFNESSSQSVSRTATIGLASLPPDTDNDGIPGRAGMEYPVLAAVPPTSFSCSKQPLNGYYADTETACQVVHLCQGGVQSSILCPNGTIFNQEKFSCQWWYEVNCSRAPIFYQLNDNLYKTLPGSSSSKDQESAEIKKRSKKVDKHSTNFLVAS